MDLHFQCTRITEAHAWARYIRAVAYGISADGILFVFYIITEERSNSPTATSRLRVYQSFQRN